jgi:hypothetical protein
MKRNKSYFSRNDKRTLQKQNSAAAIVQANKFQGPKRDL